MGAIKLTCEAVARVALGESAKKQGAGLLYHCPNHQDEHDSLLINPQKDVFMCGPCGASGTAWALAAFLAGVEPGDKKAATACLRERGVLSGAKRAAKTGGRGPCVATYVHTDADGSPVARKLRFEPGAGGRKKDFAWQRYENGEWADGLGGVKTPLYRANELRKPYGMVVYSEGEKCVDAGWRIGIESTTAVAVGTFRRDHVAALRKMAVCIIADADDPGRKDAQRIAALLHAADVPVSVCKLPHHDLADAVAAGMTHDEIFDIVDVAPPWEPNRRIRERQTEGVGVVGTVGMFATRHCAVQTPAVKPSRSPRNFQAARRVIHRRHL